MPHELERRYVLGYRQLDRLTAGNSASAVDGLQNFTWTYDAFGNRTGESATGPNGAGYQQAASYNTQNQDVSLLYDAAGDVTTDNLNSYLYDAEGRVCAVRNSYSGYMTGYLYDAAGNRVAKGTITSMGCDVTQNGFQQTAGYMVDAGGQQLTEVDGSNAWVHTNIYAAGKQIGTIDEQGTHYYIDDPLGTRREQVSSTGTIEAAYQSLPFGDGYNPIFVVTNAEDPTENHFTGKERDSESGLDYFNARYYGSMMGRFVSPDPSGLYFAAPENPQTLNLYSYVGNNPLYYTDPSGLYACSPAPAGANVIGEVGHFIHNLFCNPNDGGSQSGNGNGGGQQPSGGNSPSEYSPTFSVTSRVLPPTEFGHSNGTFMNENIREASLFRYTPPGMSTAYIYFTFRTGGREDYKNKMWIASDEVDGKITLTPDSYMDFGNLNYGESARAAGLPDFFVQRAPGFAHQYDITHSFMQAFRNSFLRGSPFGDQKRDQHYVSGDKGAYQDPDQ